MVCTYVSVILFEWLRNVVETNKGYRQHHSHKRLPSIDVDGGFILCT
jgi:hypothetical protein